MDRNRAAADLAVREYADIQKIRAFVSAQPEEVRSEVQKARIATGLSAKELEKRF